MINAKEVHELENGFIIKNSNDKYVYINSDLEIKTEEFDYINGEYSEYGVLICKNNADHLLNIIYRHTPSPPYQ